MLLFMTKTLDAGTRISVTILRDRAYSAMYAAEHKFGHNSDAHRVAWSVFSDAMEILSGSNVAPRAYNDNAERSLGLDMVEALCTGRRARKGVDVAAIVAELAARPHTMGTPGGAFCTACKGSGRRS